MISLNKGVLRIEHTYRDKAKLFYEFAFLLNMVVIFTCYQIKLVASITTCIMFAASVFLLLSKNKNKVVLPYIALWYLGIITFGLISGFWAKFLFANNISFALRLIIILLMITSVSIYVDNMRDLNRILSLFLGGTVIIVLLELYATGIDGLQSGGFGSRFSGCNPNDITVWMDFACAIAFYRAYIEGKKYMYLVSAGLIAVCAFSGSRKGLIVAIAAPLMIVFLSIRKKNYILRIILALILVMLALSVIMENDVLYSIIGKRIESMVNYYNGSGKDGSITLREYFISVAKEMFRESPLIGKGMGNFSQMLARDYGVGAYYSHNNYWQLLSELGLIGCFIYYAMYAYCTIILLKMYFTSQNKMSVLMLTTIAVMFALDTGIVSYCSKFAQLIIVIVYCSTYAIGNERKITNI